MTDNTPPDKLADLLLKIKLWFFRDLNHDQRFWLLALLYGSVAAEEATNQTWQWQLLSAALSNTRPVEAEEASSRVLTSEQGEGVERLATELRERTRFPSGQPRISPEKALEVAQAALSASPIPVTPDEGLARTLKRVQLALDNAKANEANTLLVTTLEAERLVAHARRPTEAADEAWRVQLAETQRAWNEHDGWKRRALKAEAALAHLQGPDTGGGQS